MRFALLTAFALLAACSPAKPPENTTTPAATASTQPPGTAGSSGTGHNVPDADDGKFSLDPISLIGAWSFDRTCASEDGMGLDADGKATFDEWGEGMWAVSPEGKLVLVLREHTPGVDDGNKKDRLVLTFTPKSIAGDDLVGSFAAARADIPAREINAKRC